MYPTPINKIQAASDDDNFHAGHFLHELLIDSGHDIKWLSSRMNMNANTLSELLEMPNMDAELFVRVGLNMKPLFDERIHEMVFGKVSPNANNSSVPNLL